MQDMLWAAHPNLHTDFFFGFYRKEGDIGIFLVSFHIGACKL